MKDEELAEEYADKTETKDWEGFDITRKVRKQAFLAGLKAGRPQWHKVADGDLPKAYQKCYFIYSNTYGEDNKVIFSEGNINVLTGLYAFYLDEETGEETTDPCFYDDINDDEISPSEVYAWKEIVLPELPKESETRSDMFPEIILPEGSAEFVEKIIADAEKRLKESK